MAFPLEIYLLRRRIQKSHEAEKRLRHKLAKDAYSPDWIQDDINAAIDKRQLLDKQLAKLGASPEKVEIYSYQTGDDFHAKEWKKRNPNYKRDAAMKHMDRTKDIMTEGYIPHNAYPTYLGETRLVE